jgi:antitoxin (DNA-binding transcriptional repressor) of toxin-antitoxin stability system
MRKLDVSELREGRERELIRRINEILRLIEEDGETIEITDRGKVIAHVVPTNTSEKTIEKSDAAAWEDLKRLAVELDPYWPENIDAVEVVRDIRRDL